MANKPNKPGKQGDTARIVSQKNDVVIARKVRKISQANAPFQTRVGKIGVGGISNTTMATGYNFYSPQLSTDFLELPQTLPEKRQLYRFFYGCLVPGTHVLMSDLTERPIEEVKMGDTVINALGCTAQVNRVFSGPAEDDIYDIKVAGIRNPIRATKQHPFYIVTKKQVKALKKGRVGCRLPVDVVNPEFLEARDIQVGDYAAVPVPVEIRETSLTPELMELLGYYCAEGTVTKNGIRLHLNKSEERTIAETTCKIAMAMGAKQSNCSIYKDGLNGITLSMRFKPLKDLCVKHVGMHAKRKVLSEEFLYAPPELQAHFLGAYLSGDGCCLNGEGIVAVTASQKLATQLQYIASRIGIIGTIYKVSDASTRYKGRTLTHWRVTFPSYSCEVILPYTYLKNNFKPRKFSSPRVFLYKHWILRRIKRVDCTPYFGTVWNLNIDSMGDGNSFVSGGVATHNTDPMVGQALDLLTEIPISKVRLAKPTCRDQKMADHSMAFFQIMADRIKLTRRLLEMTHLYWLDGNVYIFAEDDDNTGPDYKGWNKLVILEADQVKATTYSFAEEMDIEFIPTDEDRRAVLNAGIDPLATRLVEKMPAEIVERIRSGENLLLDTDPNTGSFCFHLARTRRPRNPIGDSILERCLRVLVYRDKIRQAQSSIASRNMTPKRVVWGEGLDEAQLDALREQVDLSLMDPDFSVVANYQVNWEEYGSNDRLLDLSNEYDITDRQLMVGLGVTLELLTGEGTYTGNRISLEVMNNRFMLFREILQDYVDNYLFKPVAIRKGFVEVDEFGYEHAIYPKLSFNRLALKDNQDTFSALFDLYQKGSLPISFILDIFNIDANDVEEKLRRDFATLNDSSFNEVLRSAFGDIGPKLATETDLFDRIREHLGLKHTKPPTEEGRWGG